MKALVSSILALILAGVLCAAPVTLTLTDGTVVKGEVSSATAAEVTVTTEFGVMKVPVERLTPEAKKAAGVGQPPTAAQYEARIRQLEARVKTLQAENDALKRAAAENPAPTARRPVAPQSLTPETPRRASEATGLSYSISSTGKRHKSSCRYYTPSTPCDSSTGVPCKICGG